MQHMRFLAVVTLSISLGLAGPHIAALGAEASAKRTTPSILDSHPASLLIPSLAKARQAAAEAAAQENLRQAAQASQGTQGGATQNVQVKASQAALPPNVVKPAPGPYPSMYDNNIVVAYYGNPHSTKMGILGEAPLDQTGPKLKARAAEYDALNGDEGVIPAFHLIYGTVHADAGIGHLSDDKVLEFVQYGMRNGIIVVLDHQLGKYSVRESMERMLPFLQYPNVHLAIDPEWSTTNPGKEIGSIPASDVNLAMKMMNDYLVANNIKQRKMLMVHQFFYRMITNRDTVDPTAYPMVDLIHNADGFGARNLKLDTYRYIAQATNMPLKGFKLFYPKPWKTEGFDKPLMTPADVLSLNPRPIFINYQ